MTTLNILILAVVEGVTEYLPISSTAHLIMTSTLLNLQQTPSTTLYEVVIQTGAIFAVIILYWKTLIQHKDHILKVLASFVPTAIIGLLFHDTIKTVFFQSNMLIASSLILVGVIFIILELAISRGAIKLRADITDITFTHAVLIGVIQASAIVPGVSRAGAVMVGMMLLGYKRTDAALYSFILAIPTLASASALDLVTTDPSLLTSQMVSHLVIGSIVSCITALIVIKWLIGYLQHHSLAWFGAYRIVVGILFIALTI